MFIDRPDTPSAILRYLPLAITALLVLTQTALAAQKKGKPRQHPYLYFTAAELPALRAKLKRPPFAAKWKRLLQNADKILRERPLRGSMASELGRSRNGLGIIGTTSFAYAITGERKYADRAKKEIFGMLNGGPWHKKLFYNKGAHLSTGEICLASGLFYDWCYSALTDAERKTFREKVIEKGIRVYLDSVEKHKDWWVANPVTNWCGVIHGGCGLAALAMVYESSEAKRAVDHAWKNVQRFERSTNLEDGAGHEGVMYHRYGVNFGMYFAVAAARHFEDDQGLFDELTKRFCGYWDVYMQAPDEVYANFNDMNEKTFAGLNGKDYRRYEGGPNGVLAALLESKVPGGDKLLLWGADNGGASFYWRSSSPFWLLFRRAAPPSRQMPKPDEAMLFRGAGHVILQSPSLWLAYNGGWISDKSHHNNDLGTFVLVAGGERFVHDPGYGKKETAEHSTILIDGKGQPKGARGTYLRFGSGKGFHYFASDLSKCYGRSLKTFVRHVVMVGGKYLVIADDLTTTNPAAFEWRLQTRQKIALHSDEKRAEVRGSRQTLHVVAAGPADARVGQGRAAISFVSIRPGAKRAKELFVTVLVPSSAKPPSVKLAGRGSNLTLEVKPPRGRTDKIVFTRAGAYWLLSSVNGQSARKIGAPTQRTFTPHRKPSAAKTPKSRRRRW